MRMGAAALMRRDMKPLTIERRLLLKAGLVGLAGLANSYAYAAILDAASATNPNNKAIGSDDLLAAQAQLGENLIRYLAGRGKADAAGNFVVSPASIASILSFVDLGAGSMMRSAIHRTLGFKRAARRQQADEDLRALRNSVSAIIAKSTGDSPLALANLLAFDRAVRPKQLALLGLSGAGADVLVDSLSNPEIVDRINRWVKEKTRELIPSILEEAPETLGLVAINALYFKDKWAVQFNPARTQTETFQSLSGNVDVAMMHSPVAKFAFRQDERFIASELGYAHDDFKLVVVTTKSAPASPADFAPVAGWLGGQGFERRNGEIAMPKLSLSSVEELLRPLDAMGLRAARQRKDALEQFSDEDLIISRVVQKLELRLSEEGTEAAAATAVVTTRSLAPDDHVKMVVDKPFVFALRDRRTGLILFMGYVGAPAKAGA
jgi:serine protease inhibitor